MSSSVRRLGIPCAEWYQPSLVVSTGRHSLATSRSLPVPNQTQTTDDSGGPSDPGRLLPGPDLPVTGSLPDPGSLLPDPRGPAFLP
eukprot:15464019-Heterocapsa_arctica.AAC.1